MANSNTAEKPEIATKFKLPFSTGELGALRTKTIMTIQTHQAHQMVYGRQRKDDPNNEFNIIGLTEFGNRTRQIWASAEADDPYADWFLLKIEIELQQVKETIAEKIKEMKDVISAVEGFNINMATSYKPLEINLSFPNPLGYKGAYLIHDFDVLLQLVFTARHIGLLDQNTAHQVVRQAGKGIRRVFSLSRAWKFTGVTRDDLKEDNPNTQRVIAEYGECPEAVLTLKTRAKASPKIRKKPAITASNDDAGTEAKTITELDLESELDTVNGEALFA